MIFKNDLINIISRTAIIGTGIVFVANILCLAIAYTRANTDAASPERTGVVTIILGVVGIADLAVGFILKKRLLSPLFEKSATPDRAMLWQYAFKVTIVTAVICAALPIYGLLAILIDGNMNAMVAFSIASLAGFMILRLRPRDFSQLKLDKY